MFVNLNTQLIDEFYNRLGIKVDFEIIDSLVMSDANILRPVVGHAFEYQIIKIIKLLGGSVIDAGGDGDVDLIIVDPRGKEYPVQVKTLNNKSIKKDVKFAINLHKTHGLEKRPKNLYPKEWPCPICEHDGEEFPPFLIIPHPTEGVLIIPKEGIPENSTFPGHFADPAYFNWNSEWLNRWDLLGFDEYASKKVQINKIDKQPILSEVCNYVNLTYEELLSLWLKPSNFRMIDMNLRGNLREPALKNIMLNNNIKVENPIGAYPKYDLIINSIKVQVKGFSKAMVNVSTNEVGVEVFGSHGSGANRRYSKNDFEYLGIVIEPQYISKRYEIDRNSYHFAFIPVEDLPLHYKNDIIWDTNNKIYESVKLSVKQYDDGLYLVPRQCKGATKVKTEDGKILIVPPVEFVIKNKYKLDYIPDVFKQ